MALCAIVGTALVAVVSIVPGPALVTIPLVVVAAGAVAMRELDQEFWAPRRRRRRLLADVIRPRYLPPPPVATVDPFDVGVLRSAIAARYVRRRGEPPPYVRRDVDERLDRELGRRRFIAVSGETKAGKSRTALEALRRRFPDSPLLAVREPPDDASRPLHQLADALEVMSEGWIGVDSRPHGSVLLWLDSARPFLTGRDLDRDVLGRLEGLFPGLVTMATISSSERNEIDVRADEALTALLDAPSSKEIPLERALSSDECARAQHAYPELADEPEFRQGMAEYFAGAQQLYKRFDAVEDQATGEAPARRAVLRAAFDWRRAGMERGLSAPDLFGLSAIELAHIRPDLELGPEEFTAARTWACEPVAGTASLLSAKDSGGATVYSVPDVVYEHASARMHARRREIPGDVLDFVLASVQLADAPGVAVAAAREGRPIPAELLGLLDRSPPADAPLALRLAGVLELLAPDRAIAEYRRLAGGTERAIAAEAASRLGELHLRRGEEELGENALARAIEADEPRATSGAALALGRHHAAYSRDAAALDALQVAIDADDPTATPAAAWLAGQLHEKSGDLEHAADAWRRAIAHPSHADALNAALRLGQLHLEGRRPQAVADVLSAFTAESPAARILRAQAYLRLRRWSDALDESMDVSANRDDEAAQASITSAALTTGAMALVKLDEPARALALAEEAVRANPSDAPAWAVLARAAIAADDLDRAREAARRCHESQPRGALGHRAMAEVELAARRLDEARECAEKARRRVPLEPTTWILIGRIHLRAEDDLDAFKAFGEALERDPDQVECYDYDVPLDWMADFALRSRHQFPGGLQPVAREMLLYGQAVRRARSAWRPAVGVVLVLLGMLWIGAGIVDDELPRDDRWPSIGMGVIAAGAGAWLLIPWFSARQRVMQQMPAAWRAAEQARRARGYFYPVVGCVLLLNALQFLADGDPISVLAGTAVAVAGGSLLVRWWRARRSTPSHASWSDEETTIRRARSLVLPLAGSVLVVANVGSGASLAIAGEPLSPLLIMLWAGWTLLGSWLLWRWWSACRAVRRMPGSRHAIQRRVWREPPGLQPGSHPWALLVAAGLVGLLSATALVEGLAGDPGDSSGNAVAVVSGAALLAGCIFLLGRWWSARRQLGSGPVKR